MLKKLMGWVAWISWVMGSILGQGQESKDEVELTFELYAPGLSKQANIFITGNVPALGQWDPASVQMKWRGDQRWEHKIKVKPNYPVEYKFTQGTWSKEGADSEGDPLPNFSVQSKTPKRIRDQVFKWTSGVKRPVRGQITGTVKYHRQLKVDQLLPRDIVVWLPPGYDRSKERYPVLYMHDGQNIVDPETSAFGVDWQMDETLTKLIKSKKVNPMIVVGIYNTPQRSQEYLPGPAGRLYTTFVCDHVKPLVDKTYRTKPAREFTSVGGSSAGGICAFAMAWDEPQIFGKALCMSPSFQYERPDGTIAVDYLPQFKSSSRPHPLPLIYLDNGGVGLDQLLQAGIDALLDALKDKELRPDRDFFWRPFPDARHSERDWAKRLPQALLLLFGSERE